MLSLAEMVPGNEYLVGDGCGYDIVTCLGPPDEQECRYGAGVYQRVLVHEEDGDYEDIFFESQPGFLYIEPR